MRPNWPRRSVLGSASRPGHAPVDAVSEPCVFLPQAWARERKVGDGSYGVEGFASFDLDPLAIAIDLLPRAGSLAFCAPLTGARNGSTRISSGIATTMTAAQHHRHGVTRRERWPQCSN